MKMDTTAVLNQLDGFLSDLEDFLRKAGRKSEPAVRRLKESCEELRNHVEKSLREDEKVQEWRGWIRAGYGRLRNKAFRKIVALRRPKAALDKRRDYDKTVEEFLTDLEAIQSRLAETKEDRTHLSNFKNREEERGELDAEIARLERVEEVERELESLKRELREPIGAENLFASNYERRRGSDTVLLPPRKLVQSDSGPTTRRNTR